VKKQTATEKAQNSHKGKVFKVYLFLYSMDLLNNSNSLNLFSVVGTFQTAIIEKRFLKTE